MKRILSCLLLFFLFSYAYSQQDSVLPKLPATGALLLPQQEYDALPKLKLTKKEREKKLAASRILDAPPSGDQGNQGSCVGWGVGYSALSTVWHGTGKPWNTNNILSAAYIYNQIKQGGCMGGSYVRDAMQLVKTQGSCPIAFMSYTDRDCNTQPNAQQRQEAYKHRVFLGWNAMNRNDVNLFKFRVDRKCPVIIAFQVTRAFDDMWDNGGIWSSNYGPSRGGHCATIIGYDDARGMFKVQNSWGLGGDGQGFFWVTYQMVQRGCLSEAYTFMSN